MVTIRIVPALHCSNHLNLLAYLIFTTNWEFVSFPTFTDEVIMVWRGQATHQGCIIWSVSARQVEFFGLHSPDMEGLYFVITIGKQKIRWPWVPVLIGSYFWVFTQWTVFLLNPRIPRAIPFLPLEKWCSFVLCFWWRLAMPFPNIFFFVSELESSN